MMYMLMLLAAAGIVAADQLTKLWVLQTIPLYGNVPVLPGVFSLTTFRTPAQPGDRFRG
jgi:lipoprotein signal peptidase